MQSQAERPLRMQSPAQVAARRRLKARTAPFGRSAPVKDRSVVAKKIPAKFRECASCIFYCARRINAACNDCDAGENFEERIEELRPGRDNTFTRRDHDDFE